jgi:hypothetical protein
LRGGPPHLHHFLETPAAVVFLLVPLFLLFIVFIVSFPAFGFDGEVQYFEIMMEVLKEFSAILLVYDRDNGDILDMGDGQGSGGTPGVGMFSG